ncbi:MAG: ATP-binding protein, partial [Azovibrio sp.]
MIRPFRPGTLGRRLLLGTLAWVLATLVATGLILTDLFQDHVARQARAELRVHLNQLTGHLELDADGQPQVRRELSDPRLKQPYSGLYW